MMKTSEIYFEIPEEILYTLNLNKEEFTKQSRLFTATQLFKNHKLSSGQAAVLAGMDKFQFWMELGKLKIPLIDYDPSELKEELKRFSQ